MEDTTDKLGKLEIVDKQQLNVYKSVQLFLYTYIEGKLNVLLFKPSDSNDSELSEFKTEVKPMDNVPPFAIARIMSTRFRALFTKKNITKMLEKSAIETSDFNDKEDYHNFEIWTIPNYYEWLDMLSDDPMIQYDTINGKMIYFLKFDQLDLESLNKNLESVKYPFKFSYFNIEAISENKTKIADSIKELANHFDIAKFVKESEANIANGNLEKYLVLAVKPPSEKREDQAGFFHFPALFQGLYRKNNEKWIYNVCSVELPNPEILNKIKRIIIPGSHFSTYADHQFIKDTEVFIRSVVNDYPHIKLLGVCFGEQLIIQALGGEVKKMETDFAMAPEVLNIQKEFWNFGFVKKSGVDVIDNLIIPQAHGDEVTIIPETKSAIKNYGSSEFCKNEMLVSEDERLFLIQGHPEYAPEFNLGRVVPFMLSRRQIEFNEENALKMMDEARKHKFHEKVNSIELRKLCFSFLKSE